MSINSRAKGASGEREFIRQHLAAYWPDAKRNLDQFTTDKRDCLNAGEFSWQIKRTERLAIWAAIQQAEEESENRHSLVAFRRNRSAWYVAGKADLLVPLLSTVNTEVDRAEAA